MPLDLCLILGLVNLQFVTSFEASMATKPKEEATPLADYNESRLPDIIALADYAFHCANKGASASALDRTASTMVDIMLSLGKKYGIVKYIRDDYSNGVMAPLRVPYREVIGLWKRQYYFLFPICRWIASWFVSSTPKQS